jgi:hypothetical protein
MVDCWVYTNFMAPAVVDVTMALSTRAIDWNGRGGPTVDERAKAADAHRIARVPCDEFLFFVFLAEALKKNTVCPVVKKKSRQISKCTFLFEQSYFSKGPKSSRTDRTQKRRSFRVNSILSFCH